MAGRLDGKRIAITVDADRLRMDPDVRRFVQEIFRAGKPVGVICHGPWTLIDAGPSRAARSRRTRACAHPSDLDAFCAKIVEEFGEGRHEVRDQGATG